MDVYCERCSAKLSEGYCSICHTYDQNKKDWKIGDQVFYRFDEKVPEMLMHIVSIKHDAGEEPVYTTEYINSIHITKIGKKSIKRDAFHLKNCDVSDPKEFDKMN